MGRGPSESRRGSEGSPGTSLFWWDIFIVEVRVGAYVMRRGGLGRGNKTEKGTRPKGE